MVENNFGTVPLINYFIKLGIHSFANKLLLSYIQGFKKPMIIPTNNIAKTKKVFFTIRMPPLFVFLLLYKLKESYCNQAVPFTEHIALSW